MNGQYENKQTNEETNKFREGVGGGEGEEKPHDDVICKDGSVTGNQTGRGFVLKQGGRTVILTE